MREGDSNITGGARDMRRDWIDEEKMRQKAQTAGFRVATWGDGENATHAVCRHGHVVPIDTESHICLWQPLAQDSTEESP